MYDFAGGGFFRIVALFLFLYVHEDKILVGIIGSMASAIAKVRVECLSWEELEGFEACDIGREAW